MVEIFLGFLIVGTLYSLAKSSQLHAFSNFMSGKVLNLYKEDDWIHADINIESSYKNMLLSLPWNYKFEEMIVYEVR